MYQHTQLVLDALFDWQPVTYIITQLSTNSASYTSHVSLPPGTGCCTRSPAYHTALGAMLLLLRCVEMLEPNITHCCCTPVMYMVLATNDVCEHISRQRINRRRCSFQPLNNITPSLYIVNIAPVQCVHRCCSGVQYATFRRLSAAAKMTKSRHCHL